MDRWSSEVMFRRVKAVIDWMLSDPGDVEAHG
jgi:hypothetical protein